MARRDKKINQKNLIIMIVVCAILLLTSIGRVLGAETNRIEPEENQFLELRAVKIKEMNDAEDTKQLVMELWANNISFKRIRRSFLL